MEIEDRIRKYKARIKSLQTNKRNWESRKYAVDQIIKKIQKGRGLDRTWIYVDMDMFFAAVEIKDNPSLDGKPLVVYDNQMIMTASYTAREYGIKSGMPLFIGRKLCPEVIQIKANYPRYRLIACEFKELLYKYD